MDLSLMPKAWVDVYLGVGLWRALLPVDFWLTLLLSARIHFLMNENLANYPLTDEQANMVQVFMLLYDYDKLEDLLAKTNDELEQLHSQWDEDIARCLEIIRLHQN